MNFRVGCGELKYGLEEVAMRSEDPCGTDEWGIHLSFMNEGNDGKFEVVLRKEQIPILIEELQDNLSIIEDFMQRKHKGCF